MVSCNAEDIRKTWYTNLAGPIGVRLLEVPEMISSGARDIDIDVGFEAAGKSF